MNRNSVCARKKQSRSLVIVGLFMVLSLVSCTTSATMPPIELTVTPAVTPTPLAIGLDTERTLQLFNWQAPEMLNPHLAVGLKDWEASRLVYEPLATFDKDGNLIPFLAAEIPSLENGGVAEDGRSVTWKLKQGVQWADGVDFTAEDVRFTYEFITNPDVDASSASVYSIVDAVTVIDDYTVKVHFNQFNPAWQIPFVGTQGMILPEHLFSAYNGKDARTAPANLIAIGTGPYMVTDFRNREVLFLGDQLVQTNRIVYEANPHFREAEKPYFTRVELSGGGTAQEAARAVLAEGSVDYAWNLQLDTEALAAFEHADAGTLLITFGPQVERILLNRSDPTMGPSSERSSIAYPHRFFSDRRVRQAFAHAIDRERLVADFYGITAQPTTNVLVSPAIYYSPDTAKLYPFDLEKATALLDEAGWIDTNGDGIRDKDGVDLSILFQTTLSPVRQAVQNAIRHDLESIGFDVRLKVIDSSIFFGDDSSHPDHYRRFRADIQMYSDANLLPDPGSYLQWWTCGEIPQRENGWSGFNAERWCDPPYDFLYEQSTTELDPQRRQELFIAMNDRMIRDVTLVPIAQRALTSGVSHTIEGIDLTPWDSDVWNIKDWRRVQP
ncbi:MAG: peptide ABC transporter substrate-binding protein [Chloroflexaceae bacterium]|nr:peptide ABC transporter substrate-binding protein [Chloroflexaceae bacterium]